ncbi:lantibiotic dehydratase [Streptomyces sp. NPDC086010]|uniref:lantibiotic dehydratase n=1 Tax=Streptomyces sp. NPDC086010 TaxID=3365745 RepID=UPI0037D23F78
MTLSRQPIYRPADFGMVRTPILPMRYELPFGDRDLAEATEEELIDFLRDAMRIPVLQEAIDISTPSLAAVVERSVAGASVDVARLRKACLSVTRYAIRARSRSTPFGVLAGVAPVSFRDSAQVEATEGHVKHVRVDGTWLVENLRTLERHSDVLPELTLVVNHGAARKGGSIHFYAETDSAPPSSRKPPTKKVVRSHPVVDEVVRLAAQPISGASVIDSLCKAFPAQTRSRLTALVGQLVQSRLLLTSLQPPLDTPDPLGHVLEQLEAIPAESLSSVRGQLRELHDRLAEYEACAVGDGRESFRQARQAAARISPKPVFAQVDLRLSERVVLPRIVAQEAAAATDALWRISPRGGTSESGLYTYGVRFEELYGRDALVPLNDLLDPERGLGQPTSWARSTEPQHGSDTADAPQEVRDEERRRTLALAELAWSPGTGRREIELSDTMLDRLARASDTPPQPTAEVMFDLVADSRAAVDAGDFLLVLKGGSPQAGALFGRFGHMLPELDEPLRQSVVHGVPAHTVPAQMMNRAVAGLSYIVGNTPRWTRETIRIGDCGRTARAAHSVHDILIGLRGAGFRAVSASTGQELRPLQLDVLVDKWSTPASRFLRHMIQGRGKPWQPWSWQEYETAPHLPRIRYGRTILSPQRWRADQPMMEAKSDQGQWDRAFSSWRERYQVPDLVEVGSGDKRLVLDLTDPTSRSLFREELRKAPEAHIVEADAYTGSGESWLNGRSTEVVMPLLAASGPRVPDRSAVSTGSPHAGGLSSSPPASAHSIGGEWLFAKIYGSASLHDEILSAWLPRLHDAVSSHSDRRFFIRYRDPEDHIRLRLHGAPDQLVGLVLPRMAAWADELREAGLIRDWSLHPYLQETVRYGGPEVMDAAEAVFTADSQVAVTQLRLRDQQNLVDPELTLALNLVDLARAIFPQNWAEWLVRDIERDEYRDRFRARRQDLRALVGMDQQTMAKECGGDEIADAWRERSMALAVYRDALSRRRPFEAGADSRALRSLMHMHHNRAKGIDEESEAVAHAMARGFAELTIASARFQQT